MAIAFELAINFGSNDAAAAAARRLVTSHPPFKTGQHHIRLHEPLVTSEPGLDGQSNIYMIINPIGVGWGLPMDRHHERLRLTAAELTELGNGLYELLAQLTGYRAAQVGWDPEGYVDLADLRDGWPEGIPAAETSGLVLAEDLHRDLRGQGFMPFAPGFVWSPYQGQRPSGLTADDHTT